MSVAAVGGYGRGYLSPGSDVDLIVLHHKRADPSEAVRTLAYRLWDARLDVGYAVHTPKEALALARDRFDSLAAFLDARLLTGDEGLFESWRSDVIARASRDPGAFLATLRGITEERRARSGDSGAELEPNLKEGRGGLRDLAALGLIEIVCGTGEGSWREELEGPSELLHRVRNELHFLSGRRTDVLLMQVQRAVAEAIGFSEADGIPEEALMRELYDSCRRIALSVEEALFPPTEAEAPALEALDDFVKAMSARGPAGARWSDEARQAFLRMLRAGRAGQRALSTLDGSAVLLEALPEWRTIRCLPQRNIYHRYAVDVHSLESVAAAVDLLEDEGEIIRKVAVESRDDFDTLVLAGLLHDIGKGSGRDHSQAGAEMAAAATARMGFGSDVVDDVAWLVRNHLLLSETATRRDIGEERLLIDVAEKVGDERRLRLLFLMTVADGKATGPSGWGRWKATLTERLLTRLAHLLDRPDLVGVDVSALAHEREEKLRGELARFPATEVARHLNGMPRAWILAHPEDDLHRQSEMMLESASGPEAIRLKAEPLDAAGIWEVMLVAGDRPGLFSKVSGCLALHGLNVLGAQAYTRADGMALEVFRVEALSDEERRFEKVVDDIRKALRGRLSLDVRLAAKRRQHGGRAGKGKGEPPRVVIDNEVSDFHTVIEVHATDRVGLLYALTRALADMELDIGLAKVSTYAEDVVDVFYVRDLDGQKVSDPEHLSEIERTILHRLGSEA